MILKIAFQSDNLSHAHTLRKLPLTEVPKKITLFPASIFLLRGRDHRLGDCIQPGVRHR